MNNTLVKGMQILEELADRKETVGVSELALQLGMGKSNVHRTLQALVELGYVVNEGGSYRASLKMWELGARVIARLDVRQAALPAMHWLLDQSRETVHLSVLERHCMPSSGLTSGQCPPRCDAGHCGRSLMKSRSILSISSSVIMTR